MGNLPKVGDRFLYKLRENTKQDGYLTVYALFLVHMDWAHWYQTSVSFSLALAPLRAGFALESWDANKGTLIGRPQHPRLSGSMASMVGRNTPPLSLPILN